MRIVVDQTKCIASGQCALIAAAVFDQRDEDGVVMLLDPHPAENLHAAVRQAAELCPSRVITLEEDD